VTSGGKINAYAAQAFTDYIMLWLADNHTAIGFGGESQMADVARAAFLAATSAENNPGCTDKDREAEGGSATGAFVAVQRCGEARAILHGASIGDAAVILVRPTEGSAQQLNPVHRKHDRDNGGQLTLGMGLDGHVWAFANEIGANEFAVLATDGLTDNVRHEEFDRIVPLVMSARLFDAPVAFDCESIIQESPEPPSLSLIRKLTAGNVDACELLTCVAAARRLSNYVEWVTRIYRRQEERYYSACIKLRDTQDAKERETLQADVTRMADDRRAMKKACKTDDAMIIVLRPFHTA
jgi:serine/threonine protein phosphatase PrpC